MKPEKNVRSQLQSLQFSSDASSAADIYHLSIRRAIIQITIKFVEKVKIFTFLILVLSSSSVSLY